MRKCLCPPTKWQDAAAPQGLPPDVMPGKKDFINANRYDLARVVERYGGLYELAEKLSFQARGPHWYGQHFLLLVCVPSWLTLSLPHRGIWHLADWNCTA